MLKNIASRVLSRNHETTGNELTNQHPVCSVSSSSYRAHTQKPKGKWLASPLRDKLLLERCARVTLAICPV